MKHKSMPKLSDYLIIIIGNYLTINEVIIIASTWRRFKKIFESYYSFYEREWRNIFTSNLEIYRNLLLSSKSLEEQPEIVEPSFMLKCNASKSWKKLIRIGLNLKSEWRSPQNGLPSTSPESLQFLGNTLLDCLKCPDLSVPALLKEDNWVEFHSSYQQYIYEYLFRQQDIQSGGKPKVNFTYLTEDEETCRRDLEGCVDEAFLLSQEILENDHKSVFFRLRWYSCENVNFM